MLKISLLHVKYDDRIWPSFLYTHYYKLKERILIGSMVKDEYIGIERGDRGLSVDDMVTVVIYKSNTFNDFLRENSGLLLLTGVFTLILN